MRFEILGRPISKARHRSFTRGKFSGMYNPQKKEEALVKQELSLQLQQAINSQHKEIAMEASNLALVNAFYFRATFYFQVEKSATPAERNAKLWGLTEHTGKPDADNLAKFYMDCCNGIVYGDDSQVCLLKSIKKYSDQQRIVIDIMAKKQIGISEQVKGILEIFGPDKLNQLIEDFWELIELYDVDEDDDWVADKVGQSNVKAVRLARTAYLLSLIADNHGKAFKKIQCAFPEFWKDAERIEREVAASRQEGFINGMGEKKEHTSPIFQEELRRVG